MADRFTKVPSGGRHLMARTERSRGVPGPGDQYTWRGVCANIKNKVGFDIAQKSIYFQFLCRLGLHFDKISVCTSNGLKCPKQMHLGQSGPERRLADHIAIALTWFAQTGVTLLCFNRRGPDGSQRHCDKAVNA